LPNLPLWGREINEKEKKTKLRLSAYKKRSYHKTIPDFRLSWSGNRLAQRESQAEQLAACLLLDYTFGAKVN